MLKIVENLESQPFLRKDQIWEDLENRETLKSWDLEILKSRDFEILKS